MVKVQIIGSGQIKEFPPKMAELLIKIRKARYVDAGTVAVETNTPAPVIEPTLISVVPLDTPVLFESPPVDVAPFEPAPVFLPDPAPVLPEPVISITEIGPEVGPDLGPDLTDKAMEPEAGSDDAEVVKPKRRYRRRDMSAEG